MTHSSYAWHDLFVIYGARLIYHTWTHSYVCDMTHSSHMWLDSFIKYVTWLICHMCDMTHSSCVWHDSCATYLFRLRVTRLIHNMCDMTHSSCVRHDSCATYLIRDTTHSTRKCHAGTRHALCNGCLFVYTMCVYTHVCVYVCVCIHISQIWYTHYNVYIMCTQCVSYYTQCNVCVHTHSTHIILHTLQCVYNVCRMCV